MSSAPSSVEQVEAVDWRVCPPVELSNILEAASEAFYEHGFHGTSVRDIAGRVGVTVPALYYHHENKEAILVAALEAAIRDLLPRSEAAIAEAEGDTVHEFANLIRCISLHTARRAKLASLDNEYRYLSSHTREPYAEARKQNELLMRSVIDRGVERGVFNVENPSEATRGILGMLQAISRWFDPAGSLTPEVIGDRYVALALTMVGVAPDRAAEIAREDTTRP